MPPLSALIELAGVGKTYGGGGLFRRPGPPALHPLDLTMSQDRPPVIALVGESGSGKTTLGNILLGLIPPSTGQLRFAGKDVWAMDNAGKKDFRRNVQAITQDPFAAYNPFYPVDHALTVPIQKFGLAKSTDDAYRLMAESCEQVGLNPRDTLGRFPHQLSGGQRQRLMVARALLLRPRLLVADEPVSMVDASLRATILNNIVELNKNHKIAIVYITHDIITAYHVADEVLVLFRGHVVERGTAAAVIGAPKHPYTQLLVSSIPHPDLSRKWGESDLGDPASEAPSTIGCPFASRCPKATEICRETMPETVVVSADQTAKCHHAAV
jgi:peptide/nickel transport system ATP-binding protein